MAERFTTKIRKFNQNYEYKLLKNIMTVLMKLEHDVLFNINVQPAYLWTEFNTDPLGQDATVTGRGVVETGNYERAYNFKYDDVFFSKHKLSRRLNFEMS